MSDFLDKLSPEARKAFEQATQKLRENEVQIKADSYGPQTPPRKAEQTRTTEPKLNETVFPNQQRGANKIQQAMEQSQQSKDTAQEKIAPEKAPEPER